MPTTTGFITQEKYILGRSLSEIERLLGFHTGRLAQGATFLALEQVPQPNEFEFAGYSQVAGHHFQDQYGQMEFDQAKMKAFVSANVFTTMGPDRLIKVMATIRHNPNMADDDQYPPGSGVPQWRVVSPINARVVANLAASNDVYKPTS